MHVVTPRLYKAPPKREITEAEQAELAAGGTLAPTMASSGIAGSGVTVFAQIEEHVQHKADPGTPPAAEFGGNKKGEAGGVMAMKDLMVKEVNQEMSEMEAEENNAQSDYEKMMTDSAQKRAEDSKLLADKGAAQLVMEADLEKANEDKSATSKELVATKQYIAELHGECEWLLQYSVQRKEARDNENDEMGKAQAVLSGAVYSLIQTTKSKNRLRVEKARRPKLRVCS